MWRRYERGAEMKNEEVIEILEKEESYMLSHGGDRQAKALRIAIDKIEQEPRWIPVAEKLPEDSHAVLVWCPERKNIYCAYREVNQWWIFGAYFEKVTFKVIAWMPLPEAYKAESEG